MQINEAVERRNQNSFGAQENLLRRGAEPERLGRHVELKVLELAGYQPELRRCTACKREIVAEDQFFSLVDGGVVCPRCADARSGLIAVGVEALKYLRYFQF